MGAAVALHLALGVWLASYRLGGQTMTEASLERTTPTGPDSSAGRVETSPSVDRHDLQEKIAITLDAFAGQDPQKLVRQAEGAADWLETRSSEAAINEIGEVVQDALGARTRAYAPVDPPPPGDFDYGTMLPCAVRQITGEDGAVRVVYTWVDEQGRSLEVETSLEASDPALTTALQMAQRSPMMWRLFQTSVLPVLESQLKPQR